MELILGIDIQPAALITKINCDKKFRVGIYVNDKRQTCRVSHANSIVKLTKSSIIYRLLPAAENFRSLPICTTHVIIMGKTAFSLSQMTVVGYRSIMAFILKFI